MANLSTLLNRRTPEPTGIVNEYGIVLPHSSSLIEDPRGCVIVGETTSYCSCSGCCCLWTVPAGVYQAQFQIWGAGGNSTSCQFAQCCSHAAAGGSGEYAFVMMNVAPGQTYTLCAGGGLSTICNNCWDSNEYSGCNSFVCGSNSTCILSCGGHPGSIRTMCSLCARELYPKSHGHNSNRGTFFMQTSADACTALNFGWPSFRCNGINSAIGPFTSANRITQAAKVPSIVGGVRSCGNSICYMCYFVPSIECNHNVCSVSVGWTGGSESGCYLATCSTFNKPGMGGPAPLYPCAGGGYGGPNWGSRGRSGLVIVKFR